MTVLLYSHDVCGRHDTGRRHPERPARLDAAIAGVRGSGIAVIEREAPRADTDDITLVHDAGYIADIKEFCARGGGVLDADTFASTDSWEAALRAAGAGIAAVGALDAGIADTAFLAIRPPGHHALIARAMGFCLFNNIAITAAHLTGRGERVAIVDWDVHHGNGTQDTFYAVEDVLYISLHEYPNYPGTGGVHEVGAQAAAGTTINFPFPPRTRGDAYREAYGRVVLPVLRQFDADWVLVSAGYDAHRDDPLASLALEHGDYGWMAARLAEVSPPRRTIYFLEGGYDLRAIEASVAATIAHQPTDLSAPSPDASFRAVDAVETVAASFWEVG